MKKTLALLSFTLLAGCCSDAFADEFGSRFGSSSPYALQNTLGKATDSLNGIGAEDLNTITPAAGDTAPAQPAATAEENKNEEGAAEESTVAPATEASGSTATDAPAPAAPAPEDRPESAPQDQEGQAVPETPAAVSVPADPVPAATPPAENTAPQH